MSSTERRKKQRITFHSSAFVEKEHFGGADDSLITNVSTNGISIQTALTLKQGEYVSIQIENPTTLEKIRLMGEVSWVDNTDENTSQAGIVFHPMDNAICDKLRNLLALLQQRNTSSTPEKSPTSKKNIHAEIEKILQINPTPLNKSTSDQSKQKAIACDTQEKTIQDDIAHEINAKKPVSLFTIVLLLLLLIAAIVAYYTYRQVSIQEESFQTLMISPQKTPPTLQDGQIIEQDLDAKGDITIPPTPTKQIPTKETPPPVIAQTPPLQNTLKFNTQKWLKEFSWRGNASSVEVALTFSQPVDPGTIKVQKLNFDPQNIRFLLRIPAPEEILSQKEIIIDHPLVKRARLGMHAKVNREIHIVFDVTDPTLTLSTHKVSPHTLQIRFQ